MKILVTGGAGFIGSHVVDLLLDAGHDVAVVDNLCSGRKSNLNPRARFYQVDIRSPELEQVFAAEQPEVVDHHAAQVDVRRSVAEPDYDADVNIKGSLNLLNMAVKHKVRKVIYISSGGAIYGEPEYLPCDENHPVKPLNPYGATKYMVELYLYIYRQVYGLDFTVIRYPNVFGPRQDPNGEAGVVAIFTGKMLKGLPVSINGSGEQVRDFVYVGDCARANLMVLDKGSGQAYNLAHGIGSTINHVYQALKAITQYPLEAQYGPAKAGETFRIYLDASKAQEELGWQPTVSLEDGLRKTVDYFKRVELAQSRSAGARCIPHLDLKQIEAP